MNAEYYVDLNTCICSLCFPNAIEVGEVCPGYWLGYDKGVFTIHDMDGHKDMIAWVFRGRPWSDPDVHGNSKDPAIEALEDKWLDQLELEFPDDPQMGLWSGYCLVSACIEAGFGKDDRQRNMISNWLFDRCGLILEKFEREKGKTVEELAKELKEKNDSKVL